MRIEKLGRNKYRIEYKNQVFICKAKNVSEAIEKAKKVLNIKGGAK